MPETTNIIIAGVGGQGVLLISSVLARAALLAGHDVKTNEVHGMAQRGGSVVAEVRYGTKVFSPLVEPETANLIASLEEIEALRYAHYLAPDGLAVVSQTQLVPTTVSSGGAHYPPDSRERLKRVFPNLRSLDLVQAAKEVGNPKAGNMVLLGVISTLLAIPPDRWEEAIETSVNSKFLDLNRRAFALGREKGRE
ncbi:MAG: indolepyruvate oxidoreductase subunit beta [Planctomycetota bacterium]|jgi:indolepyruvate ferredoxin oxidoreductase beta subunit|nr:indolepyruvate oxidoreductase subunit beta [Planctomycetota bacterium]